MRSDHNNYDSNLCEKNDYLTTHQKSRFLYPPTHFHTIYYCYNCNCGVISMDSEDAAKGVKLPYFHRTLSPADTALIGDIRPKAITSVVEEPAIKSSGSAWNSANTWEERDFTGHAKDILKQLFCEKFELPKANNYLVVISPTHEFTGDAQITHVRGTARFMYEFSFELKIAVIAESGSKYKGKVVVSDVINDQLDDIELALTWTTGKAPPNSELSAVRNAVLNGKVLKNALKTKMLQFETEFRKARS